MKPLPPSTITFETSIVIHALKMLKERGQNDTKDSRL